MISFIKLFVSVCIYMSMCISSYIVHYRFITYNLYHCIQICFDTKKKKMFFFISISASDASTACQTADREIETIYFFFFQLIVFAHMTCGNACCAQKMRQSDACFLRVAAVIYSLFPKNLLSRRFLLHGKCCRILRANHNASDASTALC